MMLSKTSKPTAELPVWLTTPTPATRFLLGIVELAHCLNRKHNYFPKHNYFLDLLGVVKNLTFGLTMRAITTSTQGKQKSFREYSLLPVLNLNSTCFFPFLAAVENVL